MARFKRKHDQQRTGEEAGAGGHELGEGLSEEELALQQGEAIPDRAALSTLKADVAIPLNPALAADVLSGMSGDELEDMEDRGEEEPGEHAGADVDR